MCVLITNELKPLTHYCQYCESRALHYNVKPLRPMIMVNLTLNSRNVNRGKWTAPNTGDTLIINCLNILYLNIFIQKLQYINII